MTITYAYTENDILTLQQFLYAKSPRSAKRRKINQFGVPLVYVALGCISLYRHQLKTIIFLAIITLLWIVLYPVYERWYLLRYFKGFIKDNFSDTLGRPISLEITPDHIMTTSGSSVQKFSWPNVTEIYELPVYIIVSLKNALAYIIPKERIPEIEAFKNTLKEYAPKCGVKYTERNNWKW